jgi:hypothetical protein
MHDFDSMALSHFVPALSLFFCTHSISLHGIFVNKAGNEMIYDHDDPIHMMMTEQGLSSQDNQLSLTSSDKARERMGMTTFKFSTTADGRPKTRQDKYDGHNHNIDNKGRQGKTITRQGTASHATARRGKARRPQGETTAWHGKAKLGWTKLG